MGFLDNAGLGTLWKNIVGKSIPYGYCTTGASTRAKKVTVSPAITELTAGVQILVKFQYANTASTTSSPVTLNVNGLGAKDIKRYGSTNISNSATTSWNANSVVLLTYDGAYWQLTDYNNTTYSGMTDAEVNAGTSGTNRLITPARLKYAIQHWSTGEANVQSDWGQTDSSADDFIKNKPTIPTKTSELTNDSGFLTGIQAPDVVFAAQGTHYLDPTSEVDGALNALDSAIGNKVDKVTGKGLSTNDYTTAEQTKLAGIATGAEVNVNADWNATSGDAEILNKPTIPSKTSDLTNDSGFITANDIPEEVFVATYNVTTHAEVLSAYNDGKLIICNVPGGTAGKFAQLTYCSGGSNAIFTFCRLVNNYVYVYTLKSTGWENVGLYTFASANRKINGHQLTSDITLTASDVGASVVSWTQTQSSGVVIGTIDINGTSTTVYAPTSGGTITETDPVFTASPAYGITAQQISDWNNKPSLITLLETGKNAYVLNVNGSTATLIKYGSGTAANFLTVFLNYTNIQDCFFGQVINGVSDIQQAQARLYEIAELDMTTQSVRLVSVDDGVVYTADLQDTGSGLTGTFSSQTIGTLTTETDPTVPSWAKEPTKPSYTASEVGALATTGGQLTGDLTLKSDANTNSKSLIFQRGTLTDNYNDWQIQDRGGFLYFDQRGTNSSSFSNQVCFNTSGNVQASTFNGYSLAGASAKAVDTSISAGSTSTNLPTSQAVANLVSGVRQLPAVTASDNGKVLRVVDGAWSAESLPSASGVSF